MASGGGFGGSGDVDTLYIDIQARLANMDTTMRELEREVGRGSERAGGAITNHVGGAMAALPAVAATAAAAVGAALVAGVGAAVSLANEAEGNVRDFQAQLGVTAEEAERLGGVAQEVFKSNFGESLGEAAEMVKNVRREFAGLSDTELTKITTDSAAIADSFEEDQAKVVQAIKSVMESTGASAQEATDLIAKGFQSGLNSSDDFLDTLLEYGPQFDKAGISAAELYSLLETGSQKGVLGTDKIADAFKEFSLRAADGAKGTIAAYKELGLSYEKIENDLKSGKTTYTEVFKLVTDKLKGVKNEADRTNIITALFGGAGEDLGKGLTALNLAKTKIEDVKGATDSVAERYDTIGALLQSVWRSVQVEIIPVGKEILALANDALPEVKAAIQQVMPVVSTLVQSLVRGMRTGRESAGQLSPVFEAVGATIKTVVGAVLPVVQNVFGAIVATAQTMYSAMQPAITSIGPLFSATFGLISSLWKNVLAPALNGISVAVRTLQPVFSAVFQAIGTQMQSTIRLVTGIMNALAALLRGDVTGAVRILQGAFASAQQGIRRATEQIRAQVLNAFSGLGPALRAIGAQIIDGLVGGLRSGVGAVGSAARKLAVSIISNAKTALRIQSPSREMFEVGEFAGEGLALGLEKTAPRVQRAAAGLANKVKTNVVDILANALVGIQKKTEEPFIVRELFGDGKKGLQSALDYYGVSNLEELKNYSSEAAALIAAAYSKILEAQKNAAELSEEINESYRVESLNSIRLIRNKFLDGEMIPNFSALASELRDLRRPFDDLINLAEEWIEKGGEGGRAARAFLESMKSVPAVSINSRQRTGGQQDLQHPVAALPTRATAEVEVKPARPSGYMVRAPQISPVLGRGERADVLAAEQRRKAMERYRESLRGLTLEELEAAKAQAERLLQTERVRIITERITGLQTEKLWRQEREAMEALEARKNKGLLSEVEYLKAKERLDIQAAQAEFTRKIRGKNEADIEYIAAQNELEGKLTTITRQGEQQRKQVVERLARDRSALKAKIERAALDNQYKSGLISDMEYQKAKEQLAKYGAEEEFKQRTNGMKVGSDEYKLEYEKWQKNLIDITQNGIDERLALARKEFDDTTKGLSGLAKGAAGIFAAFGKADFSNMLNGVGSIFDTIGKGKTALDAIGPSFKKSFGTGLGAVSGFVGVVGEAINVIGNIGNAIMNLSPSYREWKSNMLEIAKAAEQTSSAATGMIKNVYSELLKQDAKNRETIANAGFWQNVGWALFGGKPEVMAEETAKFTIESAKIFNEMANNISGSLESALMNAFEQDNWEGAAEALEKSLNSMIVKMSLQSLISTSGIEKQIQAYAEARAKALEDGVITGDEQNFLGRLLQNIRHAQKDVLANWKAIANELDGLGQNKKPTTVANVPSGSIMARQKELQELQDKFNKASSDAERQRLRDKVSRLQEQIKMMQDGPKSTTGSTINTDIGKNTVRSVQVSGTIAASVNFDVLSTLANVVERAAPKIEHGGQAIFDGSGRWLAGVDRLERILSAAEMRPNLRAERGL